MLESILRTSTRHPWYAIMVAIAVAVAGVWSALRLPLDAVPDMTNVQVQIVTKAGSLSPVEVERMVTTPIELELSGLPKSHEIRSISRLGISLITVVFEEGTDLYWARQLIAQRIEGAVSQLPANVERPQLGPLTTALGEILQFEVRGGGYSLTDLRSILEWEIAPRLRRVPGVTEVNAHGGLLKTFQIEPNPDRMAELQTTFQDIAQAVEASNSTVGGGYIIAGSQQRFIQGDSRTRSLDDLNRIVLRSADEGFPIFLQDVANVREGSVLRQGIATRDNRGEIVIGMAMMQIGENARVVSGRVREALHEIEQSLPNGVRLQIIYDREGLVERAIHTVLENLLVGGLLVVIVLLAFLGSIKAGLITALAIPLSMLFASNAMLWLGVSASLMSLGAIDFGMIVDSSVIMIENCMHRLSSSPESDRQKLIEDAAIEVRKPTLFGELIIAIVFVPLLLLEGSEGKLFRPMVITLLLALLGSMLISITVMPALAVLFLPKPKHPADKEYEKESWLVRVIHRVYRPLLDQVLHYPGITVCLAIAVGVLSVPVAWNLGAEFMPRLEEGDLLIEAVRLPSATLEGSREMTSRIESIVRKHPQVRTVFCKTGRPEIANDIMGVHQTDVWVMLTPKSSWKPGQNREKLIADLEVELTSELPGVSFGFTQPIEMRVDELVAGVKSDVAILIYGENLDELARLGKKIASIVTTVEGAADVKADYQANLSSLKFELDHEALSRYGIDAKTALMAVSALGEIPVATAYIQRQRFPITIRLPEDWRQDIERIRRIPLRTRMGETVLLKDVSKIEIQDTPPAVEHEEGRRRTFVSANVRGRDTASFVKECQLKIGQEVNLPVGYHLRWGGDFENLQSASQRLLIITPIVIFLIGVLLHATFHSIRSTLLVILSVPAALVGGIFALYLRGMPFSISAGVGFIALLGVAVLNSLVWVSAAESKRVLGGQTLFEVVRQTAISRLRPILMTASVATLGFLPMALSTGDGAEIQRPLATVVIGGLITSTLLTTLVLPSLYEKFAAPKVLEP